MAEKPDVGGVADPGATDDQIDYCAYSACSPDSVGVITQSYRE